MSIENFLSDWYQRHNKRRQEHLATLRLPIAGRSVLEVGAGIGDHTSYFLDRGCRVTATDARPENVACIKSRYPEVVSCVFDLDIGGEAAIPVHDVVYCYGVLYHLAKPEAAVAVMAALARELLLIETCVVFGDYEAVNPVDEDRLDSTQAAHGLGCRPTRPWIFSRLKQFFPYVYATRTQPWHEEFPLDWTGPPPRNATGLHRSVFVASRYRLHSAALTESLPVVQARE
jgi:SAM-dependent methyltransferase